MNCLEFRREALIGPNDIAEEAQAHELVCTACAEFAARLRGMDAGLDAALRVPIPAKFSERIIASTSGIPPLQSRRRLFALAASVTIAAGIGAAAYWLNKDGPLALAGIVFVVEEEANAILHAKPADEAVLRRVAQQMKIALPAQMGAIRYIGTCPFQGTIAHHVIMTTPQGKATLLLLPDVPVAVKQTASARGLQAFVAPAELGSIAVVAGSERSLERIGSFIGRA